MITTRTIETFSSPKVDWVLVNYEDVIGWYQLPFYKKWFVKKPIKQIADLKK